MTKEELALPCKPASLESFLDIIVAQRFKAYRYNPSLSRMITWQQLETENYLLTGIENYQPDNWEIAIQHLQREDLITQEHSAELICIMTYGIISNAFFDHKRKIYENPIKLENYKNLVINGLIKALKPEKN